MVADHGMEESNPEVTGDWGAALSAAVIDHRDEAYSFIYLDVAEQVSRRSDLGGGR